MRNHPATVCLYMRAYIWTTSGLKFVRLYVAEYASLYVVLQVQITVFDASFGFISPYM